MLYQNSNITDMELKQLLVSNIAGFKDFNTWALEDDIYLFLGSIGSYVQYCSNHNMNQPINQVFEIINKILDENHEIELQNMITVQVFEKLYDNKKYFDVGLEHLNETGRMLLLSIKDNFAPLS